MIGKTISHYKILEELPDFVGTSGEGGMPLIINTYNNLVHAVLKVKDP